MINMAELLAKMIHIDSIVKWSPNIMKEHLHEIHEYEPHKDNEFNFMNFIIDLVKSYRKYRDDLPTAFELINKLEEFHIKFTKSPENGTLFSKIKDGLQHIILATKIHLLLRKGTKNEIHELLDKIPSVDTMNNENKAAIFAIRGTIFALFTNDDEQAALAFIDKALTLDPDETQWLYVKALFTRKIRFLRNRFEVPSLQEKELFEQLHDKEPDNVVFKLYLATIYHEVSLHAFRRQDQCVNFLPKDNSLCADLKDSTALKDEKSIQYYKEAIKQYSGCPYVTFRYVHGVLTIHKLNQNTKVVNEMLKTALEKDPESGYGNLVMASYCEKLKRDFKMIKHHLEICQKLNVFDAEINMVRLQYKEERNSFNAIEALLKLIEKYENKHRQAMTYSQIASYTLLIENDLVNSIEYAKKLYQLNVSSSCLKVHRSCFVPYPEPFNLLDVLIDEIRFKMWGQKTSKEIREACEQFMHFMNFQNVPIIKGYPQNFRQQVLEGRPMFYNPKCQGKPSKACPKNKPNEARSKNPPKNAKELPRRTYQNKPSAQPRENSSVGHASQAIDGVPKAPQKTVKNSPNTASQLPSLLGTLCIQPRDAKNPVPINVENTKMEEKKNLVEPIPEQTRPVEPKEKRSPSPRFDKQEALKYVLDILTKNIGDSKSKTRRRRKSHSTSSSDFDEFSANILKNIVYEAKKNRRKKHSEEESDANSYSYKSKKDKKNYLSRRKYDSIDSDSEYERKHRRRRKDRSLERLRRKCRTGSDNSGSERKYKSRHYREDSSTDRSRRRRHDEFKDSDYEEKRRSHRHRDRSRDHRRRHHSRRKESLRRRDSQSAERRSVRNASLSSRRSKKDHSPTRRGKDDRHARRTPSLDRYSNQYRSPERKDEAEKQCNDKRDRSHESIRTRERSTSRDYRDSKSRDSRRKRKDSSERESIYERKRDEKNDRRSRRTPSLHRSSDRILTSENKSELEEQSNNVKRDRSRESVMSRTRKPSTSGHYRHSKRKESRRKRRDSRSSERENLSSDRYSKRDNSLDRKTSDRRFHRTPPSCDRISSSKNKLKHEGRRGHSRERSISFDRRSKRGDPKPKENRRERKESLERRSVRDLSLSSTRHKVSSESD